MFFVKKSIDTFANDKIHVVQEYTQITSLSKAGSVIASLSLLRISIHNFLLTGLIQVQNATLIFLRMLQINTHDRIIITFFS